MEGERYSDLAAHIDDKKLHDCEFLHEETPEDSSGSVHNRSDCADCAVETIRETIVFTIDLIIGDNHCSVDSVQCSQEDGNVNEFCFGTIFEGLEFMVDLFGFHTESDRNMFIVVRLLMMVISVVAVFI